MMGNLDSFSDPGDGREHAGADHIRPLLQRLRLNWLLQRFPPRLVRALYVFVNSFLTIGVLALLALVSGNPFVFPSLGPTAYLLFFSGFQKPPAHETLFSVTPSGSSAAMGLSLSRALEPCRSECNAVSSGHESLRLRSRWRPRALVWFCSKSAIHPPEPQH